MAQFYGVNNAAAKPGPGSKPIVAGDGGGAVRISYDEFVTVAGMLIGDTIDFGPPSGGMKKGDRLMWVALVNGALGAGVTVNVGDDAVAARYINALSVAAAGIASLNVATGFGFVADKDRPMRVTIAGAVPAAGQKLQLAWDVLRA